MNDGEIAEIISDSGGSNEGIKIQGSATIRKTGIGMELRNNSNIFNVANSTWLLNESADWLLDETGNQTQTMQIYWTNQHSFT